MDEIKNVISQLPPQDIAILKTLYNQEMAKQDLTENGQRMIAILDGLSTQEQQEAVDVAPAEMPNPDQGDVNVEVSETNVEGEASSEEMAPAEEPVNPAGNFEDYLI